MQYVCSEGIWCSFGVLICQCFTCMIMSSVITKSSGCWLFGVFCYFAFWAEIVYFLESVWCHFFFVLNFQYFRYIWSCHSKISFICLSQIVFGLIVLLFCILSWNSISVRKACDVVFEFWFCNSSNTIMPYEDICLLSSQIVLGLNIKSVLLVCILSLNSREWFDGETFHVVFVLWFFSS